MERANRPHYVKWYKTAAWARLRKKQLAREPLCRFCRSKGIITEGIECDHIQDHKGEESLFYDIENIQTLCKPCHSKKTIMDNSPSKGATMIPQWMPQSKKPFTLVCGPPASGKNFYVEGKKQRGHLVVDLDDLANKEGINLWEVDKEKRSEIIRYRNKIIADYFNGKTEHSYCWIIATASCPEHIKFWESRGGNIVRIKGDVTVCIDRIRSRNRGMEYYQNAVSSVRNWGKRCLSCKVCNNFGCDENGIVEAWK